MPFRWTEADRLFFFAPYGISEKYAKLFARWTMCIEYYFVAKFARPAARTYGQNVSKRESITFIKNIEWIFMNLVKKIVIKILTNTRDMIFRVSIFRVLIPLIIGINHTPAARQSKQKNTDFNSIDRNVLYTKAQPFLQHTNPKLARIFRLETYKPLLSANSFSHIIHQQN